MFKYLFTIAALIGLYKYMDQIGTDEAAIGVTFMAGAFTILYFALRKI